jgi:hypothetical protein
MSNETSDRPPRPFLALLGVAGLLATGIAHAGPIGPTPYLRASDSPIVGSGYTYFEFQSFESGSAIDPRGATVTGSGLCISPLQCFPGIQDSVDEDDGAIDGLGRGRSLWSAGPITITFSAAVLGQLPNAVGLVWTDGAGPISFEAYDALGVLLGTVLGNHADGAFTSGTAEDRFYGWTVESGGISRVVISNAGGPLEIDHLQYGFRPLVTPPPAGVPEPGTLGLLALGTVAAAALRRRRR